MPTAKDGEESSDDGGCGHRDCCGECGEGGEDQEQGRGTALCADIRGALCVETVVYQLGQRGVTHLLVEGGAQVITSFLKENLADEACVYIAPKGLGAQGSKGLGESLGDLTQSLELKQVHIVTLDKDVRLRGLTPRAAQKIGVEVVPTETGDALDARPETP